MLPIDEDSSPVELREIATVEAHVRGIVKVFIDQTNGRGMRQPERARELRVRDSLPKAHDIERRRRGVRLVGVAFDCGPDPLGDLAGEGGEHVGGSEPGHSGHLD